MSEEFIAGLGAVAEALKSGRPADTLFVVREDAGGRLGPLIALAKSRGLTVKDAKREKLEQLCGSSRHGGVVLSAAAAAYAELEDILASANAKHESPFLLLCDEIEDPHNLGAILRTAEAAGVHGVVVPRRRSAPLGQTVARTSAGAIEYIPVARVGNLCDAILNLKKQGLWVYGADMAGEPYDARPVTGPVALVIGSEGKGLGRLVRERCDGLLSLPMRGKINSLNASVAAGILMYEIAKHR